MTGKRRGQQARFTREARGRDCSIRLAGICASSPENAVPCHFRMAGLSGLGYIPEPLFVAWGCGPCHAYVDTHRDAETRLAFAEGVLRTQSVMLDEGLISLASRGTVAPIAAVPRLRSALAELVRVVQASDLDAGDGDHCPTEREWFDALAAAITLLRETAP